MAVVFKSSYSLLKSTITIEQMLNHAKTQQEKAIVIADENVLFGAIEFFQKSQAQNIIAHIGMQLLQPDIDVLIIAKNQNGYDWLKLLSSKINSYDYVFIDSLTLFQGIHDVIIIINNLAEPTFDFINQIASVDVYVQKLELFSLQNDISNLPEVNYPIINCLNVNDKLTLNTLAAISENTTINLLSKVPQAVIYQKSENIIALLEQVTVIFDFTQHFLPTFSNDVSANQQLFASLCRKGIKKRYGDNLTNRHIERLQYEMQVISEMGFIDYFLIIWDVMRFARKADIIIGPGRGSAVGSIVAYVLGITKIDPLTYNLLFERFLNKDRKTLPDIDIDVEDTRRNEILKYLREKYGREYVANILTFGTFGAKSAVRDVAKAHGLENNKITQLSKQIKDSFANIEDNIKKNSSLRTIVESHTDIAHVIEIARLIEKMPRHTSTHAAGVILTKEPLENYLATIELDPGLLLTQATMHECEHIGLLKIDFLGLRNLTIIRQIAQSVAPTISCNEFIETQIPDNDKATFELLSKGETTGIFQLESRGMRQVLKQFTIEKFIDIASVLALYRPGPMQFIPEYIARKNTDKIYDNPINETKEILNATYGIMVYQEQIMEIAQKVGQMNLNEADNFRRAIAKKDKKLLELQRQQFISGATANKIEQEISQQLFDDIIAFANYGFNKSHAVAYAKIAYQMAYLKTHYLAVFMVGLINSVTHNEKKVFDYLQESTRLGLKILPLDINKSEKYYTVEQDKCIRIGLIAVKGLGRISIDHILTTRKEAEFANMANFLTRTDAKIINESLLYQLNKGYAFSCFSKNQRAVEKYIEVHEMGRKFQSSIVQIMAEIPQDVEDYSLEEREEFEKNAYGYVYFAHPLLKYPPNEFSLYNPPKSTVNYFVVIDKVKVINTKTNKQMAFIVIRDMQEQVEAVVFPEAFLQYQLFLQPNRVVKILLRFQKNDQRENEITRNVIKIEII